MQLVEVHTAALVRISNMAIKQSRKHRHASYSAYPRSYVGTVVFRTKTHLWMRVIDSPRVIALPLDNIVTERNWVGRC